MKKIITSILVAIIVGMATYIIFDIYQIPENDNELITQTTIDKEKQSDNLFVKKKECAGYKEKIMEDIMIPTLIYNDSNLNL